MSAINYLEESKALKASFLALNNLAWNDVVILSNMGFGLCMVTGAEGGVHT